MEECGLHSIDSQQGAHNEHSGFIKGREFLDQLSNISLTKRTACSGDGCRLVRFIDGRQAYKRILRCLNQGNQNKHDVQHNSNMDLTHG